jgi:hypothetical protein
MFKGFIKLSEQEIDILLLFKKTGYLVMPDIKLPEPVITKVLISLNKKSLIKGSGPWYLTKLGYRYLNIKKN